MIGKRAVFMRAKWRDNGHGIEQYIAYSGKILDKYSTVEKQDGKRFQVDKYILEGDDGVIDFFYPDELTQIINEEIQIPGNLLGERDKV